MATEKKAECCCEFHKQWAMNYLFVEKNGPQPPPPKKISPLNAKLKTAVLMYTKKSMMVTVQPFQKKKHTHLDVFIALLNTN